MVKKIAPPVATLSQPHPEQHSHSQAISVGQRLRALRRAGWLTTLVLGVVAVLMLTPILVVASAWLQPMPPLWAHLRSFVLPKVLANTGLLFLLVTLIAGTLGTYLAWLTSVYRFFGQRFFAWALMLPFAIPAYVLAFVSVGLFDYSGIIQSTLRELGVPANFAHIRSVWGAGVILSLVFYPYVYLLARQAFLSQGKRLLEAGQLLGLSRRQAFFRVALPAAMPWIIGGLLLTWMETLADFGAVSVFNLDTFTTAIYKAWFSMFSLPTAAQLAALLIATVLVILLLERFWQRRRQYLPSAGAQTRLVLEGWRGLVAFLICATVFTLAFLLPMAQLLYWALHHYQIDLTPRYWQYVRHTLVIAGLCASAVAMLALMMAWLQRRHPLARHQWLIALANLGYAVPGTVLAVGVFIPMAWLDNRFIAWGWQTSPLLSGSIIMMIVALMARFLTVGFQPIDRQLHRLTPSQEAAARLLTDQAWRRWRWLVLPVVSPGVATAMLMVFVEVTKEMPITLMTRRHGFDTLAVRVFEMTSEGMYERAALPSLAIVLVGLLPVMLLIRQTDRQG